MTLELEVQNVTSVTEIPTEELLQQWASAALRDERKSAEVVVRLVDEEESQRLNWEYRHKDCPTNVLSFPSELPPVVESDLLGDLVICAQVVLREAAEQGKSSEAHWAHMVVHGVLHLLGYDHQDDTEAETMERLERKVLADLNIKDPYEEIVHE